MAIYVDDIEVDWGGADLKGVLQTAQEKIEPAGRVIVEVVINGETIVGDAIAERQDDPVDGQEVRLVSADPRELTRETLGEVRTGLESIREDQARAAELLQQDEPAEALKAVGEVLQAWLYVQEAVLHAAQLNALDLDDMAVDGTPVAQMTQNLLEQFRQLKEQLTAGDFVGVADALAYEWPATVDAWDRLLEVVIQSLDADGPTLDQN